MKVSPLIKISSPAPEILYKVTVDVLDTKRVFFHDDKCKPEKECICWMWIRQLLIRLFINQTCHSYSTPTPCCHINNNFLGMI